jgi:hypothetical protein
MTMMMIMVTVVTIMTMMAIMTVRISSVTCDNDNVGDDGTNATISRVCTLLTRVCHVYLTYQPSAASQSNAPILSHLLLACHKLSTSWATTPHLVTYIHRKKLIPLRS